MRGLAGYRVIRSLGQGGQARTIHAFDTRLERHVCLKIYEIDRRQRRIALDEAKHLARVSSDSTTDIYDAVFGGGYVALVTQYVAGCDLEKYLNNGGQMLPAQALNIVTDLARGLSALHLSGIVHGDLKAGNVLLSRSGNALLTDFGASTIVGRDYFAVSPQSMAPEQISGAPATPQTDIFALGLLLFRLLVGRHPFEQSGVIEQQTLLIGELDVPPLGFAQEAANTVAARLVREMLAPDPDKRPDGVAAVRRTLAELRVLLPTPSRLNIKSFEVIDQTSLKGGPLPRLPKELLRPSILPRLPGYFSDLWSRSTEGARVVALFAAFLPIVLLILQIRADDDCIVIEAPSVEGDRESRRYLPRAAQLSDLLTTEMKKLQPSALVLGTGEHSDSSYTIHARGVSNACIPTVRVRLRFQCDTGECLTTLSRSTADDAWSSDIRLRVPVDARKLRDTVERLLEETLH
ncbi:MAG: serine/threonine-protein kinase [Pseudomonadota bacterium]